MKTICFLFGFVDKMASLPSAYQKRREISEKDLENRNDKSLNVQVCFPLFYSKSLKVHFT